MFLILQPGVQPGDLIFVIQQEAHQTFERQGENLVMKHTLTLSESLCGFQFVIRHLDGRDLVITRPPGHVVPSGMTFFIVLIYAHGRKFDY